LLTVMLNVPLCEKSVAGIVAVNVVALINVVGSGEPFTSTFEDELKFVPDTFKVKLALLGATLVGERLPMVGKGLLTVNVVTTDGLPPGFTTVTKGVPPTAIALAGIDADNCVGLT